MYVCVCKAVSDKRIEREATRGVVSLKELSNATGLGTCCGKCVPDARRHLADAVARRNAREHMGFSMGAVAA